MFEKHALNVVFKPLEGRGVNKKGVVCVRKRLIICCTALLSRVKSRRKSRQSTERI